MFCPACRHHFAEGFRHCPSDGTALRRSARATREIVVDPFVGRTLDGRYRIEHRLGEGRLGVVYAARHVALDKLVAVKILRREMCGDAVVVRRFAREARAASQVGHPAIADVTDFGQTEEQSYLVMEHLEGETLEQRLRDGGRPNVDQALDWARQIARGLAAAHARGVVHRDLKPANVFLQAIEGAPERVKILDFGLSKIASQPRTTMLGTFLATAEYVAPEQAAGEEADGRADVYALGVILYQMLAGRVPFRAATATQTLLLHLQAPVPSLVAARPDLASLPLLEAVVLEMLGKSKDERFASMDAADAALAAVQRALLPLVEVRPPAAPPAGTLPLAAPLRTRPGFRQNAPSRGAPRPAARWPVATGVAAAALIGTLAGAWLARRTPTALSWAAVPAFAPAAVGGALAMPPPAAQPAAVVPSAPLVVPRVEPPAVEGQPRTNEARPAPPSARRWRSSRRSAKKAGAGVAADEPPAPGLMPFPAEAR